ncbi:MAG TPA: low molecular weight protein-tyrosine-phosphatase [Denitromonas sp.]|uniref:low molecular weight protein-tyrosine-phosphatase n=1 Tax=Denitromonas sp. TaxID=2734609 RepID=UPI001D35C478|nr:low molecular weight phosphotyrosine protein phosphatase [Rhodocyclaceae bacterium]MCP5220326.1 low molecular weight phosphotyrosine protein phosphatase [Zoogloeaceae bacterium]HPR05673.1 low molecular weight protein-tyrosine-phosphatase [Denitromonas sp.]HQU88704.1 low molecular weight protein-tyrosine-phosphatase [Denitromonas sp.]HQV15544.1 low molecular weight protein-tyrosine-phosphatase [Denitromonas sp.]
MRKILFVCTGNICRSPTAEAVARHWLKMVGLDGVVSVDSAGTQGSHAGEPPDPRSQRTAAIRGYDLSRLRARKLTEDDFAHFDLLLAMDAGHLKTMQRKCPPEYQSKLRLFLSVAPDCGRLEVPDPYYGSGHGFDDVLDLCETGVQGLVDMLRDIH